MILSHLIESAMVFPESLLESATSVHVIIFCSDFVLLAIVCVLSMVIDLMSCPPLPSCPLSLSVTPRLPAVHSPSALISNTICCRNTFSPNNSPTAMAYPITVCAFVFLTSLLSHPSVTLLVVLVKMWALCCDWYHDSHMRRLKLTFRYICQK